VTTVLDAQKLKAYWVAHRHSILERKFDTLQQEVVTPNYVMPYSNGVPVVLKMLEDFVES
jgi:hypothetical protein